MNDRHLILVINPGSTSTKVAVYQDESPVFAESFNHDPKELAGCAHIFDQLELRRQVVLEALAAQQIGLSSLSAVACRGGRLRPLASGTYLVNDRMLNDSRRGVQGEHASNLACVIGDEIARSAGVQAYIVDPVSVDEFEDVARLTGVRHIQRVSLSHALNMKAVARRASADIGKPYPQTRLIVVHIGGGGSVSLHLGGKMVDLFNCDKEGPFSAERAGSVPSLELVDLCFSGRFTKDEIVRQLVGGGGLMSHLGTKDARELEKRVAAGDRHAVLVLNAMAYQYAKAVGALAAAAGGQIDVIAVTGGMAHFGRLVDLIGERVGFIAPVRAYPGENELEALAAGVLRVLRNEEAPRVYE